MKCIVFGAGNAGRPVARILNHVDHEVIITDRRSFNEFPEDVQNTLQKMENEGVKLYLGIDEFEEFDGLEAAYISPSIPENSMVVQNIFYNSLKIIENEYISQIIQEQIGVDILGITGTVGKTSTTNLLSHIFKETGFNVWTCSTLMGNLLSETIVEGIINGAPDGIDLAILELPHGTIRILSKIRLKVGILTNIFPEHLTEFDGSLERYAARKLLIADMCDTFVANQSLKDQVLPLKPDALFYHEGKEACEDKFQVHGFKEDDHIKVQYHLSSRSGELEADFELSGYYVENAVAATTAALCYGLDQEDIENGLRTFKGIPGRLEYFGEYCDRKVYFDAAYIPQGIVSTLDLFQDVSPVVLIDNPDTALPKDKFGVGEVVGRYAKVMISSGFNETTGVLDMEAAEEVLKGAESSKAKKIAVESMIEAGELAIKHSQPGDTILHVGSGAVTNYENVKNAMVKGLKQGCKKYGNKPK
jgi:UDP-N-acetylmuramoylalanine--D-glutamate ligase